MSLPNLVLQYLQHQTPDNFLALRQEIIAAANYAPYLSVEKQVYPLFEQRHYEAAAQALRALLPGMFLSAGFHNLLGFALAEMGNKTEAQQEYFISRAIINSLLKTGEGSQAQPYLSSYISDEYDVLKYLNKQTTEQKLVQLNGQIFDWHRCADESELWFDITVPFGHPASHG